MLSSRKTYHPINQPARRKNRHPCPSIFRTPVTLTQPVFIRSQLSTSEHGDRRMDVEAFIERHPRLFHMAEAGAWESIRCDGLLSTSALLDLYGYEGERRLSIESQRRSQIVTITHPRTGATAKIRDNKPLRPQFLEACLTDMTAREWYELLNRKVFFWVREERLLTLLSARPYRNRPHDVIMLDTAVLLARGTDGVKLAPINTGATLYPTATPRGSHTFKSIEGYPIAEYVKWRGRQNAIVELAVDYKVERIEELALEVTQCHRGEVLRPLW
jgi:hypothetical protein